MVFKVRCTHPDCGQPYRVAEDQLGHTAVCKKSQEAKTLNKRLATQVRAVQKSRNARRRKAESAERALRDLESARICDICG